MNATNDQKICLITGANKGIGFETARQLARRGMVVLLGSRDAARGEAAAAKLRDEGLAVRAVQIDVVDGASIAAAAAWVEAEYGRLEVLVNNAGIALDADPPSRTNLDSLRQVFEVNVVGVIAVTNAFLPLLRRAGKAGRIVNVSSGLGSFGFVSEPGHPYSGFNSIAYPVSKTAVNMITLQYANELREVGTRVNAANPGYTATELNNFTGTQTVAEGAEATVSLATLDDDGPSGLVFGRAGRDPW